MVLPIIIIALYNELTVSSSPTGQSLTFTRWQRFLIRTGILAIATLISLAAQKHVAIYISLLVGVTCSAVSYVVPVVAFAGQRWASYGKR